MMIWDTFLFRDELSMLECRLETLYDVIDRFVIVEGDATLQAGAPKESVFIANRARFSRWSDKITHVIASLRKPYNPLQRENDQREQSRLGVLDAAPEDIVMHSDLDEIPHPDALMLMRASPPVDPIVFRHNFHAFAVDWLFSPVPSWNTVAAPRDFMLKSFSEVRATRAAHRLADGPLGWHFSWLGGPEENAKKVRCMTHPELVDEWLPNMKAGTHLKTGVYMNGHKMTPVDVDSSWPAYVHERRCPPEWFRPRS